MDLSNKIKDFSEYISEAIPEEYVSLRKLLSTKTRNFASFDIAIEACLQIVTALRKLHMNGLCHPHLNDSNVFINPETGHILFDECDDIHPAGFKTKILGTHRFIAPELIRANGDILPDIQSDRHSLAVILFIIIFGAHPLEGRRWLVPCITDEYSRKLYGTDPIFVFDPENKDNPPVPKIHRTLVERWNLAPQYLKDAFIKAFSNEALTNPSKRPLETQWLSVLMHFKNDIVNCPATHDECSDSFETCTFEKSIVLPDYTIAAREGTIIYKHQLVPTSASNSLKPFLTVVSKADDPTSLGLKNISGETIKAFTPKGIVKRIENNGVIPILDGITIVAYGKRITLNNKIK